jgi:PIN domain nuclease of toxin-antitoxin system
VILLDAYALVALLRDEAAADEVEALLRDGKSAVTVVNLAEAVDVVARHDDVPVREVHDTLEPLLDDALALVAQDAVDAFRAADLRRRYYDRRARALSLADCLLLAACGEGDSVATADPPLAEAARSEGLTVVALPDSTGVRPSA